MLAILSKENRVSLNMIQTINLTKKYGKITAVDRLNLNVKKGEIYGFLGPNGAGKTTTIFMLLGIVKPTKGKVVLFGNNLRDKYFDIKSKIGVASEERNLYCEMTAKEYLSFFADLFNVKNKSERITEILRKIHLYNRKDDKLNKFSRGMKQKIEVARALIHDPELLILDEPVSGLDPNGIKEIRDIILEENSKGKTILISSHILSEIEKICHRVGIINNGILVKEDKMANMKKKLTNSVELEIELDSSYNENDKLVFKLNSYSFIKEISIKENLIKIKTDVGQDYRAKISQILSSYGATIISMNKKEISLEDIFMTITEKNISILT